MLACSINNLVRWSSFQLLFDEAFLLLGEVSTMGFVLAVLSMN